MDCGIPASNLTLVSEIMIEYEQLIVPVLERRKETIDYCFLDDDEDLRDMEKLVSYEKNHFIPREDLVSLVSGALEGLLLPKPDMFLKLKLCIPSNVGSNTARIHFILIIFILFIQDRHFFCACINFLTERVDYLDNKPFYVRSRKAKMARNAANIMEKLMVQMGVEKGSQVLNYPLKNVKFGWQSNAKNVDCGVFMMLHGAIKTQWLEEGDSNTAYFHGAIKKRISMNKVIQIEDQYGTIFFDTPVDKSPGPDGYTSAFFKDSWDVIGEDVCAAIKDFFSTGKLLNQINATNITLILKLAQVLPDIISDNQGAFIKGRSIIENVLIRQDIVKLYNRKAVSLRCLLKIDLQKAYDTVEWNFVEQLLQGLQFPDAFIHRVMTYIKSTSVSLCLNESIFGYFKGKRGLRWPFQYHPLCKATKLNHLMFADDLLMFCKGNTASIMLLLRAFSSFSRASGLTMNSSKSEVYYNGVGQQLKDDIQQATGFVEGSMPFRYLRVPIKAGRLTKSECNTITEKMVSRIRSLGARKLSYAGRVVLINSVLNTLYSYWASIFLLPKSIIKRIESICRNYLWDGTAEYHRVPLIAWDKIYGKADRLWIRWVNQVYLKGRNWHDYEPPADVAWSWKSICKVKNLMKARYTDGQWTANPRGYSIRNGYEWLRTQQPKQDWVSMVWSSWNIPKHAHIVWIIMHNGLNVKDKLCKIGYCTDDRCIICDSHFETQEHLFFYCRYSQQILKQMEL
ncbi:uncharacterized protein LOC141653760 [Silene latifolia]|uniref:uncharacterized protein LOC141653760 n=1 Tax=Silene latifolia TaxID=37657 RepID=UPI003D77CCB3